LWVHRSHSYCLLFLYGIVSDCAVVSSIRDGMNLVSYEYVSCQSERQPGVLILSEFTGAAQSLGAGAISVNPWDTDQLANAILKALSMKEEERREHYRWCYHHVNKHTAQYWADSFVSSLIGSNSTLSETRGAPRNIPQSLRPTRVAHAFHAARHRLLVSGLVGTLSHKRLKGMAKDATGPLFAMASNRTRNIVNELAKDPHTTVIFFITYLMVHY
jgi:trehalose 6-phosphate synthase/phosphatase